MIYGVHSNIFSSLYAQKVWKSLMYGAWCFQVERAYAKTLVLKSKSASSAVSAATWCLQAGVLVASSAVMLKILSANSRNRFLQY